MSLNVIPFACEYSVNKKVPLSDQARPRFWFSTFAALVLSSVAIKGATLVSRMVQSFCETEL